MMNKLKKLSCLVLAMLCMAGISMTAYAADGDETADLPDAETALTEDGSSASDETGTEAEISYSFAIDEDGSLIITVDGVGQSEKATATGTVVTGGSRLNLRTGAGTDYEIIDQLLPGEEVTVIGSEGDWYEVVVLEKTGYVHGDYLELAEQSEQSGETSSDMLLYLLDQLIQSEDDAGNEEDGESSLAFTPDGNLTLVDDFLQIEAYATEDTEQMEKQFITVQTRSGNTFYLIIDRNGDSENVYFLNLVDEADLMSLMEDENGETASSSCTCTDKCVVGAINATCEVCRSNLSECTGQEAAADTGSETAEVLEETDEAQSTVFTPVVVLVLAGAAGGAVYWFKFRKPRARTSGDSDLDDYDYGQDDDEEEDTELDDADLMAETESEDDES